MDIQTFYPVFENGQVLTSEHLNDMVDYLEPQDRLTRNRLTGVGIVCGLESDWNKAARTLTLLRGVAITSEGHLIAEGEVVLDRFRSYSVPIPSGSDATPEQKSEARYPFLFDGDTQRQAFELLPTDFQPAEGEPSPAALSEAFVADKTLALFLECNLEALKNCDVNDCSEKGSEMNLTLRRLLVTRAVADQILAEEAVIAGRPVDRANHPRLGLSPLSIEKINPSRFGIKTLSELYGRVLSAAGDTGLKLLPALRDAWDAYRPLLREMFPESRFPEGPFPRHHFMNMLAAFAETPALAQCLYGGMHDILRSYNEFIECAARFDAECCPDPGRFPKHVLAGDVLSRPVAFEGAPSTTAEYQSYDPRAATGGPAPEGVPAARRHHFVPSPVLDAGNDKAAELRSLFSRTVLLAQAYATRGLLGADILLTPSRCGDAPLGDRAIPFSYSFDTTGDLFRNWSWPKARANLLRTIPSYQFTAAGPDHPLAHRQDDQDFIRVEGIVGKPLGTAMAQLIQQKRALGLPFAIEPVWIGYGVPGTGGSKEDEEGKALALDAVKKLLLCRMRDLDVIFLMIMAALFAFMIWIVQVLGRVDATRTTRKKTVSGIGSNAAAVAETRPAAGIGRVAGARSLRVLDLDPKEQVRLRDTSDRVLTKLRKEKVVGDDLVKQLVIEGAGDQPLEQVAVGSIYDKVRDESIGGELIDRVRAATEDLDIDGDKDELTTSIYPSVALMARAEEMMRVTSGASIAEFDEVSFGTGFRGFADAYEGYAAKAETDPAETSKEIADTNKAIVANQGSVAASAAQFSGAAITAELGKRLMAMFEDLSLPGYARKHPGLEYRAGVPLGGTFVLVYGSRRDIEAGMKRALADLGPTFGSHFTKLVEANPPAIAIDQAIEEILAGSKPQSEDVLDEFVVLGDFCLPYLCCDTDCSDVEIETRILKKKVVVKGDIPDDTGTPAPTPPAPGPNDPPGEGTGTVGTVEIAVFERQSTGREVAFKNALLVVTDRSSSNSKEQQLAEATHILELKPGKYGFVASSGALKSDGVEVALKAGATEKVRLVIT